MRQVSIHCDSQCTLSKAYSQVYNGKSRHIGLRHSYVKDLISNGVISIVFVRTVKESCRSFDERSDKGNGVEDIIGDGSQAHIELITNSGNSTHT